MSTHLIDCAAEMDLPPAKKLALLCFSDSADKITRIAVPGQDRILTWAGVKRARAMELINELIADGLLERKSAGRKGHMAEFWVFPDGCCPMHGPLPHRVNAEGPLQQTLSGDGETGPSGSGSAIGSTKGSTPEWTPSVSPDLLVVGDADASPTTPPPLRDDAITGMEIEVRERPKPPARRANGETGREAKDITEKFYDWAAKEGVPIAQKFGGVLSLVKTALDNRVPSPALRSALGDLGKRGEVITTQSLQNALRRVVAGGNGQSFRSQGDQEWFERMMTRASERDAAGGGTW